MSTHNLVASAAHIRPCQCGDEIFPHAHIVCADGATGPPVFSRSEAYEQLELLLEAKRIAADEGKILRDLICETELPLEVPDEIVLLDKITENVVRQLQPYADEDITQTPDEQVEEMFVDPRIVSTKLQ